MINRLIFYIKRDFPDFIVRGFTFMTINSFFESFLYSFIELIEKNTIFAPKIVCKMKNLKITFLLVSAFVALVLSACQDEHKNYVIGVSQCSGGDWREKMNDEMRREAIFHSGIQFEFCNADDDFQKQQRDVDSLIKAGVDLLVVAPIDSAHGRVLVNKAMGQGIPVIVADRRLHGSDYTAYVGGDNYAVGYNAGEYMASRVPMGGEVLEIRGHDGSSPVEMRHQGFIDALSKHPEFRIVESVDGWWLRDSAKVRMEDAIHAHPEIRAVYCHNDYMAMGAIEMFRWVRQSQRDHGEDVPSWTPFFIGVDAVYGANHGLEWIVRGDLDASVLYPTGGDVIVETAVNILEGKPYVRDHVLKTTVVDRQGAAMLNDMDLAVINEVDKVHWLQNRENSLLRRLDVEQWLLIVSGAFILFIIVAMVQMRRHYLERRRAALHLVRANRRLRDAAQYQLTELRRSIDQSQSSQSGIKQKDEETKETQKSDKETLMEACKLSPFIEEVYRLIDDNYSDPGFGVEMLSVLLNMSRSQLYRRIKNLTSMTPFDMIRDKRFSVAEELIDQGLSLDETAQKVGFSSTPYFIKCYEEYKQIAEVED